MKPQKLRTFLVKELNISNKKVFGLFSDKRILLNSKYPDPAVVVRKTDEVIVDKKIIQKGKKLLYIKFNKPRGIESTMNKKIPKNLTTIFDPPEKLFPVGRLDKDSEGLMIFTNDGDYYKRIINKNNNVEKEYRVIVDKTVTQEFLNQMSSGVRILSRITKPAKAFFQEAADYHERAGFNIVLTEGMNRQIRRMCMSLGYDVLNLKRIRIENVELGKLKVGGHEEIKE